MEQILLLQAKAGVGASYMVYDDVVFKRPPLDVMDTGDGMNAVPVIIGSNLDEMRYWTSIGSEPVLQKSDTDVIADLEPVLGANASNALKVYKSECPTYYDAIVTLSGDLAFRIPSIRLAEVNSRRQSTFMYLFAYRSTTKGPTGLEYGSAHSMELPFVFGVNYPDVFTVTGPKKDWGELSDQMIAAWTNFARSGDPNGTGVPTWPRYDATTRATMEFNVPESKVVNDPMSAARKSWADVPSDKLISELGLWGNLIDTKTH